MGDNLKIADVASVLFDMKSRGIIGRYAVDPAKLDDVLSQFELVNVWRKHQGGFPNELQF